MPAPQSTVSTTFAWFIAFAALAIGFLVGTVAVMLFDPSLEKLAAVEAQNAQLVKNAERREPLLNQADDEIERLQAALDQSKSREAQFQMQLASTVADNARLKQLQEENKSLKSKLTAEEADRQSEIVAIDVPQEKPWHVAFNTDDEIPIEGPHDSDAPGLMAEGKIRVIGGDEIIQEQSWQLDVENESHRDIEATVEVVWYDADDFVLNEEYAVTSHIFRAGQIEHLSGTTLFETEKADRVYRVSLKITK
jgi:uncharacterized membrane-anchored protein YhcB (DUF1043 family)